ncbi:MAG: DmsE family decaheme c-type cytochrome [Terracidiphilus sp.]
MNTYRPLTRRFGAAPRGLKGLQVFFMVLLGAGALSMTALAAPPSGAQSSEAPAKGAAHAEFVGSDTCASCHEEVSKKFATNPHSKMALMHGNANGATCENCHGAGSEHVAGGGDVTKIFNPAKASAKEVDEKCLSCHAGAHPDFARSPHAKANVSCIGCHDIHGSKEEALLKAPQPTLCFQCHADHKAQFNMPFHHRVQEGLVKCSDCHDPHGTFGNSNLRSTADQSMICTKCHTDVRGPFVYEHAPVKAEGCTSCHSPHGSENARLLNMPNINVLCNQCHSAVAAGTVHGQGQGSSDSIPCTTCHTYIHGSNINPAFLR